MKFTVSKLAGETAGVPDEGLPTTIPAPPFLKQRSFQEILKNLRFLNRLTVSLAACLIISGAILLIFSAIPPASDDHDVTGTSEGTSSTERYPPDGTTDTSTKSSVPTDTTKTSSESEDSAVTKTSTERISTATPEFVASTEPVTANYTTTSTEQEITVTEEVVETTTVVLCTEDPDPSVLLENITIITRLQVITETCCTRKPCRTNTFEKYILLLSIENLLMDDVLRSEFLCPKGALGMYGKEMVHLAALRDHFQNQLDEYLSQRGPWCWSDRATHTYECIT